MKKFFLIPIMMMLTTQAHARIYLEPYVGFRNGSLKGDITATSPSATTTSVDSSLSGASYGGKLGLSYMIFAIGGDYSTGQLNEKDNSAGTKSKSTYTDLGAFVHVKLPILFTVKGTYIFSAKSKDTDAESTGKGYKVGLSTSLFHFFSLNADMISVKYDDLKQSGFIFSNVNVEQKTVMFSLSMPFEF